MYIYICINIYINMAFVQKGGFQERSCFFFFGFFGQIFPAFKVKVKPVSCWVMSFDTVNHLHLRHKISSTFNRVAAAKMHLVIAFTRRRPKQSQSVQLYLP